MNRLTIALAALAVAGCGENDSSYGATTAAETSCAALTGLEIANTEITHAQEKSAGSFSFGEGPASTTVKLPDHCYVEGMSNEREGADGKTYGLGFALAMPADWNGRFLFQGGGGLNGTLHPPLGGNAAGDTPALARGFAVISTDGGHKGQGGFDASFMADQQAALDFSGQSVASGLRGQFGNAQPSHKRRGQGARVQDWLSPIQASATQLKALVRRPSGSACAGATRRCVS